jgi:hypothetical protein
VDPTPYYGPYQILTRTVPVNIGTVTELAPENYNRVCLYLACSGAQSLGVSPRSALAAGQGIVLSTNGVPWIVIRFAEDGPLVGQRWLGISAGATVAEVIEVIRDREPGNKWVLIPELEYAQRQLQAVFDPFGQ